MEQTVLLNKKILVEKTHNAYFVMLNLFQHLKKTVGYETLKQVQGDNNGVFQKDKRGLTLVEVLIALVVFLLISLALMQSALVSIDSNTRNILRDEAVSIAEMRMNQLRNLPFTNALLTDTVGAYVGTGWTDPIDPIARNFRSFSINFTSQRMVDDLDSDNKQVDVTVSWTWKGEPYTHSISTIMRKQ